MRAELWYNAECQPGSLGWWGSLAMTTGAAGRFLVTMRSPDGLRSAVLLCKTAKQPQVANNCALRVPEQQQPVTTRSPGGLRSAVSRGETAKQPKVAGRPHTFIPLHKAALPPVGGACERGHVLARWPASSNADRRVCLAARGLSAEVRRRDQRSRLKMAQVNPVRAYDGQIHRIDRRRGRAYIKARVRPGIRRIVPIRPRRTRPFFCQ